VTIRWQKAEAERIRIAARYADVALAPEEPRLRGASDFGVMKNWPCGVSWFPAKVLARIIHPEAKSDFDPLDNIHKVK
jgi:hypothetical protein